jgi:hypothetical protein
MIFASAGCANASALTPVALAASAYILSCRCSESEIVVRGRREQIINPPPMVVHYPTDATEGQPTVSQMTLSGVGVEKVTEIGR